MRFHKAIEICEHDAHRIASECTKALSEIVVVSRGDRYYDVRAMTHAEIEAFLADLARAEYAELEASAARLC